MVNADESVRNPANMVPVASGDELSAGAVSTGVAAKNPVDAASAADRR